MTYRTRCHLHNNRKKEKKIRRRIPTSPAHGGRGDVVGRVLRQLRRLVQRRVRVRPPPRRIQRRRQVGRRSQRRAAAAGRHAAGRQVVGRHVAGRRRRRRRRHRRRRVSHAAAVRVAEDRRGRRPFHAPRRRVHRFGRTDAAAAAAAAAATTPAAAAAAAESSAAGTGRAPVSVPALASRSHLLQVVQRALRRPTARNVTSPTTRATIIICITKKKNQKKTFHVRSRIERHQNQTVKPSKSP